MPLPRILARLSLTAALLGGVAGCAVVPAQPGYYRSPTTVYYEAYPVERYGYPAPYYDDGHRYYGDRDDRRYRDERRYDDDRRIESPFDAAARAHRDVRRSLGLPRLPGMP